MRPHLVACWTALLAACVFAAPAATGQALAPFALVPRPSTIGQKGFPPPSGDSGLVAVYFDAAARKALDAGDGSYSGGIAVGFQRPVFGRPMNGYAAVRLLDVSEDVVGDYGRTLLAPGSGGVLSGQLDLRMSGLALPALGVRAYGGIQRAAWRIPYGTADTTMGVVTAGAGLGGFVRLFDYTKPTQEASESQAAEPSTTVALVLDAGWAMRALGGDLNGSSAKPVLQAAFGGSDRTLFWGPEVGLSIQFNSLRAGVTYYGFASHDAHVPGFSGGQIVGGLAVSTAFFERRW